jgi:hypothetical protein
VSGNPPFIDSFDRPNGAVGNGWLEKVSGRFSLMESKLVVLDGEWKRHILYRPFEENILDVEVSAELSWTSVNPSVDCDATLMARIVPSTVSSPGGSATAYAVFIDDTNEIAISRLENDTETKLRNVDLPSNVNTTDYYRMSLRVSGTNPVMLSASLEKREPSGAWTNLRTITTQDENNARIQTAGTVGLTADVHSSFRYDNFTRTKLSN